KPSLDRRLPLPTPCPESHRLDPRQKAAVCCASIRSASVCQSLSTCSDADSSFDCRTVRFLFRPLERWMPSTGRTPDQLQSDGMERTAACGELGGFLPDRPAKAFRVRLRVQTAP